MIRTLRRPAVIAAVTLALPLVAGAQEKGATADFNWEGAIARDAWVRVHNLNGPILVEPGTGDRLQITAVKKVRRGDGDDVRIELRRVGPEQRDVLVCALWNERSSCDESGYHGGNNGRWSRDDDQVTVEFRVKLPAGARLAAGTVNGKVSVTGATSIVEASTVNGSIEAASSTGPVRASTVNGSIDVRMATIGTEDLRYSTVNGSVRIRLPQAIDADIDLSTVNGSLESDFPLTVQGRMDRHRVQARLGKGGPRLSFSTVNGSVHLSRD